MKAPAAASPPGVYPELKDPAVFRARGLDPERACSARWPPPGWRARTRPCSSSPSTADSLKRLRRTHPASAGATDRGRCARQQPGCRCRTSPPSRPTPRAWVRPKRLIMDEPALMSGARKAGLFVHGWTFRAENEYLPEVVPARWRAGGPWRSRRRDRGGARPGHERLLHGPAGRGSSSLRNASLARGHHPEGHGRGRAEVLLPASSDDFDAGNANGTSGLHDAAFRDEALAFAGARNSRAG